MRLFGTFFFGHFFPSVNDNFFFLGFLGIPTVANKLPAISLHWYPDHQFRELDQMVKIKKTHIHHLILDLGYSKPKIVIVFMLTTWMPFIRFRLIFMVNSIYVYCWWLFREFNWQLRFIYLGLFGFLCTFVFGVLLSLVVSQVAKASGLQDMESDKIGNVVNLVKVDPALLHPMVNSDICGNIGDDTKDYDST